MTRVYQSIAIEDLNNLEGYEQVPTTNSYELIRLKKKSMLLILYTSGKLVVHGDEDLPFSQQPVQQRASPQPATTSHQSSQTQQYRSKGLASNESIISGTFIGSDETLKGDTFGGLIVCAALFSQGEVDVVDSKVMSDQDIKIKAQELLKEYPERFSTIRFSPIEYNTDISKVGTVTALLNKLHFRAGQKLKLNTDVKHVVDEYPGCSVGDIRTPRAEQRYTAVAAASIVARYYGLLQFEQLSEQAGFFLPMGSTHVNEALKMLQQKKLPFSEFCKTHFRNVMRIQQG